MYLKQFVPRDPALMILVFKQGNGARSEHWIKTWLGPTMRCKIKASECSDCLG